MSLKIRLARAGAKKRPYYRIVIADSKSPRNGRYIEKVGTYNPLLPRDSGERVKLVEDRIKHWMGVGAQPTDRVLRFLDKAGMAKRDARSNPNKAQPGKKRVERDQGKDPQLEKRKERKMREILTACWISGSGATEPISSPKFLRRLASSLTPLYKHSRVNSNPR